MKGFKNAILLVALTSAGQVLAQSQDFSVSAGAGYQFGELRNEVKNKNSGSWRDGGVFQGRVASHYNVRFEGVNVGVGPSMSYNRFNWSTKSKEGLKDMNANVGIIGLDAYASVPTTFVEPFVTANVNLYSFGRGEAKTELSTVKFNTKVSGFSYGAGVAVPVHENVKLTAAFNLGVSTIENSKFNSKQNDSGALALAKFVPTDEEKSQSDFASKSFLLGVTYTI